MKYHIMVETRGAYGARRYEFTHDFCGDFLIMDSIMAAVSRYIHSKKTVQRQDNNKTNTENG